MKQTKPPWRNWITRPTSNRKIAGSSPAGGILLLYIFWFKVNFFLILI